MINFLADLYASGDTVRLFMVAGLLALAAVCAYLLGCFNGAVIVSKYILRNDVRNHGSGNAGLTNFYRVFGGPLTAAVILTDMLKMVAAVEIVKALFYLIASEQFLLEGKYWAGMFCLLGHMFPCMFQFKGGKGILSGGTLLLMVDWRIALVGWGGFILLVALTRMVSLGSVWAASSFIFTTWFVYHDPLLLVLGAISGGLVVWKHRGNIKRILNGTESKLVLRKKKGGD